MQADALANKSNFEAVLRGVQCAPALFHPVDVPKDKALDEASSPVMQRQRHVRWRVRQRTR